MIEHSKVNNTASTLYSRPLAHEYLKSKLEDHHHYTIVRKLVSESGANPGDLIVEIGAGRGRYTDVLLKLNMRVMALEPDPALFDYLKEKYIADDRVSLLNSYAIDGALFPPDTKLVCGFHVLHHMDIDGLHQLCATLIELKSRCADFSGWFFLEPNPWNPLYALMIATNSAMTFREERGVWRRRVSQHLSSSGWRIEVRQVGFWPPRKLLTRLRKRMSECFSTPANGNRPYYLYRIYSASWERNSNRY